MQQWSGRKLMTFTRFDYAAVESEKIDSQVLFICKIKAFFAK
ncbi:hypothetical protein HMPREF0623_1094 [Pediococcus acidilactici DSM 20284]|uniref:Uncharacterized protein n=1 Tax=Pediococcus acidilactici DSM 20284 TaxID=862514 RepID=E0NGP7_PEDAC|nr:hypothetical protein HMPREF0623_1094 [Pediococcus acidilactici DSM 20284]